MHDYQVSKFPVLAEKLKDVKVSESAPTKKTRRVLSPEDRQRVMEAIKAGGGREAIAKRFDIAPQTVGNIAREMRQAKPSEHVPPRIEDPTPIEPQPKRITKCVEEVYDAIEHLTEDDKLRVLLSVAYLFGMSTNLG